MAQTNAPTESIQIKNPAALARGLGDASAQLHDLAILFEHLSQCGNWMRRLSFSVSDQEYRQIVNSREVAFESLSNLAIRLLLGPVLEPIHEAKEALEEKAASH